MSKEITLKIGRCRDCHYVTNSAREHDCPFTPVPYPTRWYCTHPDREAPLGETYIHNEYKIDKYCPL